MFIEPPLSNTPLRAPPAITATVVIAAAGLIILGLFPNLVLGVISRVQTVAGL
jgi:hypothetical protein